MDGDDDQEIKPERHALHTAQIETPAQTAQIESHHTNANLTSAVLRLMERVEKLETEALVPQSKNLVQSERVQKFEADVLNLGHINKQISDYLAEIETQLSELAREDEAQREDMRSLQARVTVLEAARDQDGAAEAEREEEMSRFSELAREASHSSNGIKRCASQDHDGFQQTMNKLSKMLETGATNVRDSRIGGLVRQAVAAHTSRDEGWLRSTLQKLETEFTWPM